MIRTGSKVFLAATGNDRIPDGTPAVVERLASWGAHVRTHATVTGRYRAGWGELIEAEREATGYVCEDCGGGNLVRSGTCLLCQDCGRTSGCS